MQLKMKKARKIVIIIILIIICNIILIFNNNIVANVNKFNLIFKNDIIIVDKSGNGDYFDLQEAINNIKENGTILVKKGEYMGPFFINHSVSIIGESQNEVVLKTTYENWSNVFFIDSLNLSINNLTIKGYNNEEMNGNGTYYNNIVFRINTTMNNLVINNIYFNKVTKVIAIKTLVNGEPLLKNVIITNSTFKASLTFHYLSTNILSLYMKNNLFIGNSWRGGGTILKYGGFYHDGFNTIYKTTFINNTFINAGCTINSNENTTFKNNKIIQQINYTPLNRLDSYIHFNGGIIDNNRFQNIELDLPIYNIITGDIASISNNIFNNISGGISFSDQNIKKPVNILNNKFNNCSKAIFLDHGGPSSIKDNTFIDSGFDFSQTKWDDSSFDIDIVNNSLNGKPIKFIKNKLNSIITEDFGQLIILNCNNIQVSELKLSGTKNYSLINILKSSNVEINNNNIKINDRFITSIQSDGCQIHNNTFNGSSGIRLEYCTGMSLFNNYFHFSNKSCYDNRQNDWFRNGIGNYWEGMVLPDLDGNGISETSVKIPGGSSEDKYPLVPNVHLDLIPSQSYGTTGDILSLDVIAEPTIFNEVKSLDLYYGNKTPGFTHMRLDPEMEHQSVLIGIPTNMTGVIELFLNATDKYGLVTESTHRSIDIHDNDPPEILLVECPDHVGNGDHFSIFLKAIDNIGISRINASVRLVDDEWTVPLIGTGNDTWTLEMDADPFIVYPYNITFEAYDTSNNYARLRNIEVRIIDTVYPELVMDLTLSEGGTGQLFGFVAEITDNDGLGKVEVEYKQGTNGGTVELEQDLNMFHADIQLSEDSVEPLTYRFVIKDLSGNTVTSGERTVTIIDVLFPEIEVGEYPGEIGTGDELDLSWSTSDNIGVVNSTVQVFRDDVLIGTGAGESIRFIVPVNHLGNIVFRIVVKDGAGNERTFNSTPIRMIDTIFPEATIVGKLEWFEGDKIELTIVATDNIAVENIVWRCSGKEGFGDIIKLEFDEPKVYQIEVEVSDTSGNVRLLRENITVLEGESPDGSQIGLYLIIGAIFFILMVVTIALFFFFKKKTEKEEVTEEGVDSGTTGPQDEVTYQEPPIEQDNGLGLNEE